MLAGGRSFSSSQSLLEDGTLSDDVYIQVQPESPPATEGFFTRGEEFAKDRVVVTSDKPSNCNVYYLFMIKYKARL